MTKKIVTILIISCTLFLMACQKNLDIFVPDLGQTGPDTIWNASVPTTASVFALQTNLLTEPVRDSFEVSANAVTLLTTNGVQCTFPALGFVTNTGVPVTGKVYVEVRLVKTKGEMIMLNKPTISNGNVLVSGGELFISVSKNGQALQLAPNAKIYLRYTDFPTNQQMKLYLGDESIPAQFNWKPSTSSSDTVAVGPQAYEIATTHLRWLSCDYLFDTTGITRSLVSAVLPSNYTNANTTAFLVFRDMRSVLGMYGDVPERRFITGKVPNGKVATVVVISKQGNDYFLGKETITTGVNVTTNNIQKVILTPVKTSLADIRLYLATL
jgi:hypothetical protein